MKVYLQVTSNGTSPYTNPPYSVCVLDAKFVESVHPAHPMRDTVVVWDVHPELLGMVIATKTNEESWESCNELEFPDAIVWLNQQFNKDAREYPV